MIRSQLAELLNDEVTALRRFALMLTRSYDDAEDLAQDTIERALLKAHLFDGENLRSWLFTICKRVFLNQIRKKMTRGGSVPIDDAPASALRVEGAQEAVMQHRELEESFSRLPARDRAIISMVVLDGACYEEAAKAMNVPVGTIRSRLSRARARLHAYMEGEHASTPAAAPA